MSKYIHILLHTNRRMFSVEVSEDGVESKKTGEEPETDKLLILNLCSLQKKIKAPVFTFNM